MNWIGFTSCVIISLAVLHHYNILWLLLCLTVYLGVIILGFGFGIVWMLTKGKPYKPPNPTWICNPVNKLLQNLMKSPRRSSNGDRAAVVSRNIDTSIQDVIDLVWRDFIMTWYQDLGDDHHSLYSQLNKDTWKVIGELSERLSNVDWVKFCTQDIVNTLHIHFRDVRFSSQKKKENEVRPKFLLHSWLETSQSEEDFLRNLSEVVLLVLLPDYYSDCKTIRHLLREILCLSVLKPTIDGVTDPDYINQKITGYLLYRKQLSENTQKTYTYAETYEDFVKMIDNLDIEELKQIRYTIITEIMQATTISNLKKERGIDTDKESAPRRNMKGDLLKSRNLKRYINQLTLTKARCEKRIHALGGPDYQSYMTDSIKHILPDSFAPRKVLSFNDVMDSIHHREQFLQYLKRESLDPLLRFWIEVEKLKEADKCVKHQLGSEIYQRFVGSPSSIIHLDKPLQKRMEAFLLGNDGPESFYEAQKIIRCELEEDHYPSFIVSGVYQREINIPYDEGDLGEVKDDDDVFKKAVVDSKDDTEDILSSQSFHAKQMLDQLKERIVNKAHALKALKSQKSDEKIAKVVDEMDAELRNMKMEERELESHLLRTNTWCDNIGAWQAAIYDYTMETEYNNSPQFVILVHLGQQLKESPVSSSTQGWVVSRSFHDFQALHAKLVLIGPWLKKMEPPSVHWFRSVNEAFLEKSKTTLQDYLSTVLRDSQMMDSEALYAFLTPTPEFLKVCQAPEKRNRFFFSNLFKNTLTNIASESDTTDLLFVDDSVREDQNKDSIAKPLYELIREVFELRGVFKLFRVSFIRFVEVTFGRSINRQLRETINWLVSESMIVYYIGLTKDSFWPDGVLAPPLPQRTDEQKLQSRLDAKKQLLNSIPDAVKTLVGEANAKQGAINFFEVLQNMRLNKHLVYSLIELLVKELLPELRMVDRLDLGLPMTT